MKSHKKLKKTVIIKASDENKEKLSSFMNVLKAVAEDMGLEVADADVNTLVGSDY
tara:strand:- start:13183 stop:13347 length:165 start_codon:yes stop_codon:yes gene_type:complete